ncbi:MAG: hypothetical protein IQL11_03725 [Bacteroidales bacterium]|nr:hypothetical protein [Bacteroidales bacterium]
MKTKIFLFFCFCLLFGVGLTQLSAQNGQNGNGSVTYLYWCDVFSHSVINDEGDEIDYLEGTVIWHNIDFFKDGENYRSVGHAVDVDVYSTETGETFKVSASNDFQASTLSTTRKFNFIGNNGSHYVGRCTIQVVLTDEPPYFYYIYTFEKLVCPGNN